MPIWLFYEDKFGEFQIFMDIISVYLPGAVFPEPYMILDWSDCRVGMDAQDHSEGIAGGSPSPCPGPVWARAQGSDLPSPAQSGRGGRHAGT